LKRETAFLIRSQQIVKSDTFSGVSWHKSMPYLSKDGRYCDDRYTSSLDRYGGRSYRDSMVIIFTSAYINIIGAYHRS